jgi:hypothetical protein
MRPIMRIFVFIAIALCATDAFAQTSIEGQVRFEGKPAAVADHQVTRDHQVCGQHKPNEAILVSNGGLANVVVFIENAPAGAAPLERRDVTVANEGCRFVPHVSATTAGSTLIVENRDAIMHNTHTYFSDQSTFFNIAFPKKGMAIRRVLPKADILSFKCDVGHVWMSAYVHVFAHPFFAVSDASGNFRIDGLPPGRYTVKAWHEKLGTQIQQVVVVPGMTKAGFIFK